MSVEFARSEFDIAVSDHAHAVRELTRRLGRRPYLLLAEDDDELRWAMEDVFRELGYLVQSVSRGDQLLERIAHSLLIEDDGETPDLIVTDVRLPSFNGLGLMEDLRRAGWQTPVLVVSAFVDDDLMRRVEALGRAYCFTKPVALDHLLTRVNEAVAAYASVPHSSRE